MLFSVIELTLTDAGRTIRSRTNEAVEGDCASVIGSSK